MATKTLLMRPLTGKILSQPKERFLSTHCVKTKAQLWLDGALHTSRSLNHYHIRQRAQCLSTSLRTRQGIITTQRTRHLPCGNNSLSVFLKTTPTQRVAVTPWRSYLPIRHFTQSSSPPPPQQSFFQRVYQNICEDVNVLLKNDIPFFFNVTWLLLPRIFSTVGGLYFICEYMFKTVTCEGPSMDPTIVQGRSTLVLIERWSCRLFGLESVYTEDSDQTGGNDDPDVTPLEPPADRSLAKQPDEHETWASLFKGIWKQHFKSGIQRGDVLILNNPAKEGTICKRVIGMPGDLIIRTDGGGSFGNTEVVPHGHLWIEGDNTLCSHDSRAYGAIPASLVIGKVICRLWPLREYRSLGKDANGIEHWERRKARIGREERPIPLLGQNFLGSRAVVNGARDEKWRRRWGLGKIDGGAYHFKRR